MVYDKLKYERSIQLFEKWRLPLKSVKKFKIANETLWFILIFIFSVFLFLNKITFSDIWIDESVTKALVKYPLKNLIGFLTEDFHPPLYFLGLKWFTFFTGVSDFTIRLFSVLGTLSTLLLSYFAGQRLFGKKGALYFCLLLISLPMLAFQSHNARMYTWAAFSITGVFLYAGLFLQKQAKNDLIWLGLFSLMAAYLHYYSLIAAFWANVFVLLCLLVKKNKAWRAHVIVSGLVVLLYLPWLLTFLGQTGAAIKEFWIPELSLGAIISCYRDPFAMNFGVPISSIILLIFVYLLTIFSIFKNRNEKLVLGLALTIYNLTILTGIVFSILIKPILFSRYMAAIMTMLMVPPAIFLINCKSKVIKIFSLVCILLLGLYTNITAAKFSWGPFRQTMAQLHSGHPQIKKIIHATDVTTGPLLDHNEIGNWKHYWIKNENSVAANLTVFKDIIEIPDLDTALDEGEIFGMIDVENLPRNRENFNLVLSQCRQIQVDRIVDEKTDAGGVFLIYILEFKGKSAEIE